MEPVQKFCQLAIRVLSCPTSSAGLERMFSSFGLIHTKLRNRLGNQRVMKLVRTYAYLRDKDDEEYNNFDAVE
jgi:hypothetical protein